LVIAQTDIWMHTHTCADRNNTPLCRFAGTKGNKMHAAKNTFISHTHAAEILQDSVGVDSFSMFYKVRKTV